MSDESVLHPKFTGERPTKVRFVVIGLATLMSLLLYLDRYCIAFLINFIEEDFNLSPEQQAWLLGGFFLTYALAQVPSGWLSDRFGSRTMLTVYIVLWTLFTGLMGVATGFWMLLAFRLLCGLAQAGAYPTGASMISKWVPFSARGAASGVVAVGGRLGGAIAPLLTAYLLVSFVPMSVPAVISENDLLRPGKFIERLEKKGTYQAESPYKSMSEEAEQADKMAAMIRQHLGISPKQLAKSSEQRQREYLGEALNNLLKEKDLYQQFNLAVLKLPAEADRLAQIPADKLTTEQLQRLNRFLVEAIFPKEVRKLYVYGWRPVAIVYGIGGLAVALLFWLGVRNRPQEHPGCNEAEVEYIESGRLSSTTPHGRVRAIPIKYILQSRSLWLSSISQFGTNFGWTFLVLQLPSYLKEAHHVPPLLRGWMSSAPVFIGIGGMLCGGFLTDWLTRLIGLRWGRALPMALTRFLALAAFLACLVAGSPWVFVAAFCVVAVATDLGTSAVWAFKQDVGGSYVGSILGWGNMWGNLGAFVSPLALNLIQGESKWEYRFLACALAFAISGIAALGVDSRIPVVPDEE